MRGRHNEQQAERQQQHEVITGSAIEYRLLLLQRNHQHAVAAAISLS